MPSVHKSRHILSALSALLFEICTQIPIHPLDFRCLSGRDPLENPGPSSRRLPTVSAPSARKVRIHSPVSNTMEQARSEARAWACDELLKSYLLQLVNLDLPKGNIKEIYPFLFSDRASVELIASGLQVAYAPGLYDVLASPSPPSLDFFKSLPLEHVVKT